MVCFTLSAEVTGELAFISTLGTHIYIGIELLHLARYIDSCREVILVDTGGIEDGADVILVYATSGKEDDASSCCLLEFWKKRYTFYSLWLLTRCKDAVATQGDDIFQSLLRIGCTVEGTMEGNAHRLQFITAFRQFHESAIRLHIHFSILCKASDHYAIYAQFSAKADIFLHAFNLQRSIEKIATTRADDDMELGLVQQLSGNFYLAIRWGSATFRYACTQFHTVGSTFLCSQTALYAVGAYFKLKIVSVHSFYFFFLFSYLISF